MLRWTVHVKGGPKRAGRAAVAVGSKVYSFGGNWYGESYPYEYNMGEIDVHVFNTLSLHWNKLPPVTNEKGKHPPCSRHGHTAVLIGDMIYIWGGRTYADECCNILYAFDVNAHGWFKPEISGTVPGARKNHSACVLGKVMYIYGGHYQLTKHNNDIYKLDTTTMVWSLINTRGDQAPASSYHSATIIGTNMFVFGGQGDQNNYNNISVFDTETNCWLSTPSAQLLPEGPEGRWSHSAFAYNGELHILGGHSWDRSFNDLWKFNPETFSWKKVEPQGKSPCWLSVMCCCMLGDCIIVFGGYTPNLYILELSPKN